MKKIVITGGAGFIGINLVNNLIKKKKYKIFVLDALKYSSNKSDIKKIKKKITFYKLDITDITKLKKVLNLIEPDIVFHLAAESHVDRSIDEPLILDEDGSSLAAIMAIGRGLSLKKCNKNLDVQFRKGGESIRPVGHKITKKLKKLKVSKYT